MYMNKFSTHMQQKQVKTTITSIYGETEQAKVVQHAQVSGVQAQSNIEHEVHVQTIVACR